jgi:hypothetical protein
MITFEKISGGKIYWKLRSWANQLLMEYDECVICGSRKELEPHHIIKCDNYNPMYYSLDNGVVMCHRCHRLYHRTFKNINAYTFAKFMKEFSKK